MIMVFMKYSQLLMEDSLNEWLGIDEALHQMCENRGYWIIRTSQLDKTKKVIINSKNLI